MVLFHGVRAGDKKVVFHPIHGEAVLRSGLLGLGWGQPLPAAGDGGVRRGCEQVPALGTDIEPQVFHTSPPGLVLFQVPDQQPLQVYPQEPGEFRQKGQVRGPQAPFPLGNGLVADARPLRQPDLGQALLQPKGADQGPCFFMIHGCVLPV